MIKVNKQVKTSDPSEAMINQLRSKYELTVKQAKFCLRLAVHGNQSRSAVEAGYSDETARSIAWENLTKPNIKKAVDFLLARTARNITPERIQTSLMDIAETEDHKANDRLRAYELVGKSIRLFHDNESTQVSIFNKIEAQDVDKLLRYKTLDAETTHSKTKIEHKESHNDDQ